MLYFYEKRKIDTIDALYLNNFKLTTIHSLETGNVYAISENTNYAVANISKNGYYHSTSANYIRYKDVEFMVHNIGTETNPNLIFTGASPPEYRTKYKIKNSVGYNRYGEIAGPIYKATAQAGDLVEVVIEEDGAYPENGVQGDYWYIRTKRTVNLKYKDETGIIRDIARAYYKDSSGVVKEISTIKFKDINGTIS